MGKKAKKGKQGAGFFNAAKGRVPSISSYCRFATGRTGPAEGGRATLSHVSAEVHGANVEHLRTYAGESPASTRQVKDPTPHNQ